MDPERLKRIRELEDKTRDLLGRMEYIADKVGDNGDDGDGAEFEQLEAELAEVQEEYWRLQD